MATPTKPPPGEPGADQPAPSGRKREDAIRAGVLAALGRPTQLFRVAVVPLWDNNFRVNVVTGDESAGVLIPNSYFVKADDMGKILGSEPPIRKLY
ncbi:MAG TPA: hypothetical protein VH092_06930 [Urbifossiella sp.]|jgi:hypothetical protein|nr:hypothetical protein [Urbifossiella sp.]